MARDIDGLDQLIIQEALEVASGVWKSRAASSRERGSLRVADTQERMSADAKRLRQLLCEITEMKVYR